MFLAQEYVFASQTTIAVLLVGRERERENSTRVGFSTRFVRECTKRFVRTWTNHVKKHKLCFLYIQNMLFYQIRPGVYEAIRSHLDGSCKKTIIYVFLHKKCPFYKIRPGVYEALRFRMA